VVEVGGLRRDSLGFALRLDGGGFSPRPPLAPTSESDVMPVQGELLEALQAIGYLSAQ
jgi:hypothetical protein